MLNQDIEISINPSILLYSDRFLSLGFYCNSAFICQLVQRCMRVLQFLVDIRAQ